MQNQDTYIVLGWVAVFLIFYLFLSYIPQSLRTSRLSKLSLKLGLSFDIASHNFKFFTRHFGSPREDYVRNKIEGQLYGHTVKIYDSYHVTGAGRNYYHKSTHILIDSNGETLGNSFLNTFPSVSQIENFLLNLKDKPVVPKSYSQLMS